MTKIIVAQGMCSPIRPQVLTMFEPYGFRNLTVESYSLSQGGQVGHDGAGNVNGDPVRCNVAEITVNPQAAVWAEYLLCRSHQFRLLSPPLDPRNQRWAAKWESLPKAWRQSGCSTQPRAATRPQRKAAKPKSGRKSSIVDFFRRF